MMDTVDLIYEKKFLGQEFLAWLWYKSEKRGGSIELPGRGDILVIFEKHMLLEYGEGDSNEKVMCRGLQTELKEARAGLCLAKKPEQARIRLAWDDYEFSVTLTAAGFEFRNIRLPKTASNEEDDSRPENMEGRLLERIGLFEQLTHLVDELFALFINIRASHRWDTERMQIQTWINSGNMEQL